jgi:hypothetical protein
MYALGVNGHLLSDCPRCGGLLYLERLAFAYTNLACALCGNRLDPTILDNRTLLRPLRTKNRESRKFPQRVSA